MNYNAMVDKGYARKIERRRKALKSPFMGSLKKTIVALEAERLRTERQEFWDNGGVFGIKGGRENF